MYTSNIYLLFLTVFIIPAHAMQQPTPAFMHPPSTENLQDIMREDILDNAIALFNDFIDMENTTENTQPFAFDIADQVDVPSIQTSPENYSMHLPAAGFLSLLLAEKPHPTFNAQQASLARKTTVEEKRHNLIACRLCDMNFNFHYELQIHFKEEHPKEKPYKCTHPNCTASFRRPDALRNHFSTHTRLFKCSIEGCTKSFKHKGSLDTHTKQHFKNYICTICSRQLFDKKAYEGHIAFHELGEKLFKCPYLNCSYSYTIKSNLQRHIRKKHNTEDFLP